MSPQVELFCIDHLVMVTVEANDEFLYLDLSFPTTKLHARGIGEDVGDDDNDVPGGLNGMEAAFQVKKYAVAQTAAPVLVLPQGGVVPAVRRGVGIQQEVVWRG